jgi:predicted methyltransferase
VGPPPEMKMAREEVIKEMQAAGFKLSAEHSFLPYQYFLEFR